MRQHDAFGHAGRAGRVDQRRQVLGVDLVPELVGLVGRRRLRRASRLAELVQGHQADAVGQLGAAGGPLGQDHQLDVGDLVGPAGEVGEHLRVGDEHGLGLAVLGDVDEVLRRVGRVERDVDDARDQRAEVGHGEVSVAVHEERDVVAAVEPALQEPERDLVGGVAHLGVRHRHPARALRVVEGPSVGVLLDSVVQERRDRLAERDLDVGRGRGVDLQGHERGWRSEGLSAV